jgi:hypothetical protein
MPKFAVVTETAAQLWAALAAFVFVISGVVYLYLGHWPVTHQDYWRIYDFCLNHTWLESALLKHNSHSLFFPSFLWLADLRFFHGKQLPLFFAGLALLFMTVTLLLVPVWRDKTVGVTSKIIATLVVIVGNFWMARGAITESGGFNSICSLVTASLGVAVFVLAKMRADASYVWPATLILVLAGFVASFSFGTGLAIWPTLFVLVWCLRLPWRSFVPIGVAAVAAMVIYEQLPPRSEHASVIQAAASGGITLVAEVCRLAGSPFLHATSGWHEKRFSAEAAQCSMLSLWCGGAGVVIAVVAMLLAMIHRDLSKSSLKFVGVALVTFDFVAMAFIIAGRANHLRLLPSEVAAPRYLFWSTLFWTGLLLIAIQCAESKLWLRWPVYLAALALPVLTLPSHYKGGLHWRWGRRLAESGATSLINGVRDDQQIRILAPVHGTSQVYRVAEQLRARRLDMFADGLQDWIGLGDANLLSGQHKPEKLKGRCAVTALVQCEDSIPAAQVVGQASTDKGRIPTTLVIVDATGVVRGVARSSPTSPFINRVFYLGKAPTNAFLGYICNYDPTLRYTVRSADDRAISEEEIPVSVH